MEQPPSDPGSVHTSKSTSPHEPEETRIYTSIIIAKLDDDPAFSVLPMNVVFDDGKSLQSLFGFDPTKPLDSLKRSLRKYASLEGEEMHFSLFMRVEEGSSDNVVSKYIREFSAEIRKCKGRHRFSKYDDIVSLNRDKISKRYYCVPRTKITDPNVASSVDTGVHGTRGAKLKVATTTDSEAGNDPPGPAMEPSSSHVLQVAAAKARKELSEKRQSQALDSEQDEDDFQTQTRVAKGKKPAEKTATKAAQKKPQTPSKGKATAATTTPAKTTPQRKSARKTPLKVTPLKISTVPSVRPEGQKKILPPPKLPPRNKRTASPTSESSAIGTPAKNRKVTEKRSEMPKEGQPFIDLSFGATETPAAPSSSNAQLLQTFVTSPDPGSGMEQPTFRGSTSSGHSGNTSTAVTPAMSTAVTPVLGSGFMAEIKTFFQERETAIKDFILAENTKMSRRQYKLYAAVKELKAENAKLKASVIELITSNAKIYDKIKLVGDQSAERKGTIASLLLRFFPLDIGGEFADVFLGCNWVQKHLPPLIARQIELLKKSSVNKQVGIGLMHFLFSPYMISHFILGDTKKSLRALKPINRPIPRGVTRVILPAVIEVMKKRVTLESKDDKENVKLVRAGFSDLFGNTRTTFLTQLMEYCKDSDDLFRAAYICDKVFFECNKHFFKPGTKFFSEEEHRAIMLKRDNVVEMVDRENCGLVRKEKKRKFLPPQEAVMEMRVNVGLDQMNARETISYLIDAAKDVGERYDNFYFEKECGIKNLDAIYKKVLEEKQAAWKDNPQATTPQEGNNASIQGFPPVFKETAPKASTSGVRPSMKAILQERREEQHFPDRKQTTSSSNNDAVQLETDVGDEEEVFESSQKKKRAGKGKRETKKQSQQDDDDVSTSSDDEAGYSLDDHTSDEGSDDEALAEHLNLAPVQDEVEEVQEDAGEEGNDERNASTEEVEEEAADHDEAAVAEEAANAAEEAEAEDTDNLREIEQAVQSISETQEQIDEDPPSDSDHTVNPAKTLQQPEKPPVNDE